MKRSKHTISSAILILCVTAFYFLQNEFFVHAGGGIAFVKALWLGLFIYYWLVLPSLILASKNIEPQIKFIYKAMLFLVISRLAIELYIMFIVKAWHPYMGISHNIFVFVTMVALLYYNKGFCKKMPYKNAIASVLMLIPESFFAWYMLTYVRKDDSMIFYVPDTTEHQLIIGVTWLVSITLIIWQIYFAKLWIYEKVKSTNPQD